MKPTEFETQIKRLIGVYGEQSFPSDRTKILWGMVHAFEINWFEKICTFFISTRRQAPMVPDFQHEITIHTEKLKEKQISTHFNNERFAKNREYIKEMISLLSKKINNQISTEEFDGMLKIFSDQVHENSRHIRKVCVYCDDTGFVLYRENGNQYASRCKCSKGSVLGSEKIPNTQEHVYKEMNG